MRAQSAAMRSSLARIAAQLALLALGAVRACGAWAAEPGIPPVAPMLAPCHIAGIAHEVRCGRAVRPLDAAHPDGIKIAVRYVVVPAMARRKLPDPVFLLAGGPGQSAVRLAPTLMPLFARLNNRRDIVFVDQRGTGDSAPLECGDERMLTLAEQADAERTYRRLETCRDRLQKLPYGDLRFFTTSLAMADLDAVREQLQVERVNIVGASYGTRAALEYLRQFPHRVRRAYMDGVAPPDMALPASFSSDAQSALDALFTACAQAAACAAAHPNLRRDWAALLASLPRPVRAAHPLTGHSEVFTLTREMLLQAVRTALYAPSLAAVLPQVIADATQGRFDGLAGLLGGFTDKRSSALAMGMHFSVVCSEDLPRLNLVREVPGVDFGVDSRRMYERVCAHWPRGEVPPGFYTIAPSPTPVLITSGGLDPATPARHGERVARALGAKALHVVVPNAGHGLMAVGCMRDVLFRFIDAADDAGAQKVDASCLRHIPRPLAFTPITLDTAARSAQSAAKPQGAR